jgi:hypothetical protein
MAHLCTSPHDGMFDRVAGSLRWVRVGRREPASPDRGRARSGSGYAPCHVDYGTGDNPVYQVGGKSFVFFRNPRPDAVDSKTGERYRDVIVFWVASEADKQALVQEESSPFFATAHFDGHPSVLLRASRIGELTRKEFTETIQEAWLSRASARRAASWLNAARGLIARLP